VVDRARPRLLTSAQLAAALLLTTLFTLPFAPDRAGPDAAAAGAKKRVELAKFRTRTSRTYRNGNGTLTTSLYSGSVNYRKQGGGWARISSHIVRARDRGFAWKNEANAFQTLFRTRVDGEYLRFGVAGVNFGFSVDGADADAIGSASGERVSYRDAIDTVDLRYELFPDGLKETLVLPDADAPTRYRFNMATPARPRVHAERQGDGSWAVFLGTRTRPLFALEAPTAVDASGAHGGSPELDVVRDGNRFALELTLDRRWLRAPERVFPVLLDPTITIQPSSQDASFNAACPSCTPYLDTKLYIGTTATETWRSAVQFNLADVPAGASVTDARMKLYYSGNCVPPADGICKPLSAKLDAHRMTSAWTTASASSSLAFDPTPVASLNFTTIADADVQWLAWDVTGTVKNWLNGTQTNYGLLLKRETEPQSASGPAPVSRRYTTEVGLQPKLEVTYSGDGVDLLVPDTLHADGAELRWTPYTGPSGAPFDRYEVHRSPTAKFTPSASTLLTTIRDPNVTFFRDTTAAPSKAFSYRVVANSSVSNERRVTLPGPGNSNKTLQPAPLEGMATYVDDAGTRCTNHGAEADLWLSAEPAALRRGLVYFDVRDIPTTATVNGARLSLWRPFHAGVNAWVDAHRVTAAWDEGSGSDACTGDGASWRETQGGVEWTSPGVDYDPTPVRSINSNNAATWNNFYIDPLVQEWVDGQTPNHGLLFKLQDETRVDKRKFRYYGDDFSVAPTLRPKLFVAYTDGSEAEGPTVSVADPAPSTQVSGSSVKVTVAASDDRRVDKVEFFADGASTPFATDTAPPFETTWNSTGVANGGHTLTAKATDDAGNATTSSATNVTVHNSALPTTSVSAPAPGATVTGTTTVSATAADDLGVTKVEFYADDLLIAEDATAPYSANWNTLDQAQPSYDGPHVLETKAYDTGGQVTVSPTQTVTAANTAGTKYNATFSSTEFPQAVIYDPGAATQEKYGLDVTVTNTSSTSWSASDVVLRYRWESPDAQPVFTTGSDVSLGTSLGPGAARTLRVVAEPPTLPDGVNKAQYKLRVDLYSKTNAAWFADKGNKPLENPVIVNKALVRDALGLERYYHYVGRDVGAGMQQLTNIANGNSLLRWTPFDEPGRGLSTVLDLTYNALEKKCDCPAGNNWSLAISSLNRFGNPIDIHPNKADQIAGRSNKFVELTDGDGTTHRFSDSNSDGYWQAPAGVQLFLRATGSSDPAKYWALTRPDRVTFYYDQDGFPRSVVDANGNTLTFTKTAVEPADDPGGPKFKTTALTDAGGRNFAIAYFTKDDAKKPQIRGKVKSITDHIGRQLAFDYYFDGNLLRVTQKGGLNPDNSLLPDRSFVFTYTTSDGSGPAIPAVAERANPDPKTSNQSTRLYSVRDPRGNETRFSYLGPGAGTDRWKLASLTDRADNATTFAYDTTNRVTTVTEPLSRQSEYAYDVEGKVTKITNPLDQETTIAWSAERAVARATEPTGVSTAFTYNDNGYVTSTTDQLGNKTELTYDNTAVDANDVAAKWESGRTIPHVSDLATKTDPKGVATTDVAGDFQWTFAHDGNGNITGVTDPLGKTITNAYNADGTLGSTTDANGHVTSYPSYDANGLPTTIVDPLGNETGDALNHRTTFTYNAAGELLSVQDPVHQPFGTASRTNASFFDYDAFGRMVRQSAPKSTALEPGKLIWSSATFDANDNVATQTYPHYGTATDPGGDKTSMSYDAMDRLTARVAPHDPASTDPAQQSHTTMFAYDAAGRLTVQTDPKGVLTQAADKDFATFLDYDLLDRVVAQTRFEVDGAGAVVNTQRTRACYDLAGDTRSVTAPKGDPAFPGCPAAATPYTPLSGNFTTRYDYNAAHKLLATTDPLGRRQSLTYDANSDPDSFTDEANTTVTRSYDQKGQLVSETHPFRGGGSPKTLVVKYRYDPVGNVSKLITPRAYDASTDKQAFTQFVSAYEYDANDRLARELLPTSASDPEQLYVHHAYDGNGRQAWVSLATNEASAASVAPSEKSQFTYFDPGWPRTTKDPAEPEISFDYTAKGEQAARTRAQGANDPTPDKTELWSYFTDGDLKEEIDPHGSPTTYAYDANDNVIRLEDTGGVQTPDEAELIAELTYDGFDRLTRTRQQKRNQPWHVSTSAYDANGNVIAAEDDATESPASAGRIREFSFDQADQVVDQIDRGLQSSCTDDQRLEYTYTPVGELQDQIVSRAGISCTNTSPDWVARMQTTSGYFLDGSLSTRKIWNGRAATAQLVQTHTLSYEDSSGVYVNGNVTRDAVGIDSPGAPCPASAPCTLTYTYDAKERLVEYGNGRSGSTSYSLLPNGLIKTEAFDNGGIKWTKTYGYNAPNGVQLNSITRQDTLPTASTLTRRFFYAHGNVVCVTHDEPAVPSTRSDCPAPQGGTISPRLDESYSYDDLDRLAGYHAYLAGSETDSGQWTYDALDRAASERETHGGGAVNRTTRFDYIGLSPDAAKETWTGSGATVRSFTYDAFGAKVGSTDSARNADVLYGYNPHGDVSQLLTLTGGAQAAYGYRPYGDEERGTGAISQGDTTTQDAAGPRNNYRYVAARFDTANQQIALGARFFSPDYGSFIQRDFLRDALDDVDLSSDPLTGSRYGLAGGNPVNFVDVSGHAAAPIYCVPYKASYCRAPRTLKPAARVFYEQPAEDVWTDLFFITGATGALRATVGAAGRWVLGKVGVRLAEREALRKAEQAAIARIIAQRAAIAASRTVITKAEARGLIRAAMPGIGRKKLNSFINSFKGPITARRVPAGESFLRYSSRAEGSGRFLTKQTFAAPDVAVQGLNLGGPFGNTARFVQLVVARKETVVLEGRIAGSATRSLQTLVLNPRAFAFTRGRVWFGGMLFP
jgi:RHS repeat-associated protein